MTVTPPPPPPDAAPVVLDLTGVADRQAFMDRCTERLRLPDWFGRTWDALADCLTDLSWWPVGPGGRRLRIEGWRQYAEAKPREWRIVKDILRDAETFWRDTDTELTVSLAEDTGDTEAEGDTEEATNGGTEDRDVRP
jgi:hypothetical protein